MALRFIIKQSTPPAPQSLLVERTNETYWTPESGKGYWDTDEWVAEDNEGTYEVNLDATGIDWTGFRPTYVKVTFTQPIDYLELQDDTPNVLCAAWSIISGDLYPITFFGDDINKLILTSSGTFTVQKIEFYVPQNIWVDRTDDTYWTPNGVEGGTWSGAHWTAADLGGGLWQLQITAPASGWIDDFRPTKVRVTTAAAEVEDSNLVDDLSNFLMMATPLVSLTEYDLTYVDQSPIHEFTMYNYTAGVPFEVQKIEFYI